MLEAIQNRRSIRAYQDKPVPRSVIEEILKAGSLAPSSKNRQPWRYIVAAGEAKKGALAAMAEGLAREREAPLLPESDRFLKGAEYTLEIMAQAPILVFAVNPLGLPLEKALNPEERVYELCNAQSLGAALENMALEAMNHSLGSLWICDVYFAYAELSRWLDAEGELMAAMAFGYAAETPKPRPRKALVDIVEWRE